MNDFQKVTMLATINNSKEISVEQAEIFVKHMMENPIDMFSDDCATALKLVSLIDNIEDISAVSTSYSIWNFMARVRRDNG